MSEYCDLKIQYIRGFWVWWEYLEIYSITVYLVKGLLMNHSLERYTFKGAILPSTSLLIRFSLFSSVNDSQSVICQNCGSTEWGSSYTDTNIDPAPCPSFTTLGCIEQGSHLYIISVFCWSQSWFFYCPAPEIPLFSMPVLHQSSLKAKQKIDYSPANCTPSAFSLREPRFKMTKKKTNFC